MQLVSGVRKRKRTARGLNHLASDRAVLQRAGSGLNPRGDRERVGRVEVQAGLVANRDEASIARKRAGPVANQGQSRSGPSGGPVNRASADDRKSAGIKRG